jgi:hypothetical protein
VSYHSAVSHPQCPFASATVPIRRACGLPHLSGQRLAPLGRLSYGKGLVSIFPSDLGSFSRETVVRQRSGLTRGNPISRQNLHRPRVAGATAKSSKSRAEAIMKRRGNTLVWTGFAIVPAAFLSYILLFAPFPSTRDVPWVNLLLVLLEGVVVAIGLERAYRQPEICRGKISGAILAALSLPTFLQLRVAELRAAPRRISPARRAHGSRRRGLDRRVAEARQVPRINLRFAFRSQGGSDSPVRCAACQGR